MELDRFLARLAEVLDAPYLATFGDIIRDIVANDRANNWARDSADAMERRARLNGPHKREAETEAYRTALRDAGRGHLIS